MHQGSVAPESDALAEARHQLARECRRFFERNGSLEAARTSVQAQVAYEDEIWRALDGSFGVSSLLIPEAYGGQGCTLSEMAAVLEECGRALSGSAALSSATAATTLLLGLDGDPQVEELLSELAGGTARASLAIIESARGWLPISAKGVKVEVTQAGGTPTVSGTKSLVLDPAADHFLILAREAGREDDDGLAIIDVAADAQGLDIELHETLDLTRPRARLNLRSTPARVLGAGPSVAVALTRALDHASVGLAVEMMGGARASLESAVEYAKTRVQFGRPIGGFQALRHLLADLWVDVELGASLARRATEAVAEDDPAVGRLASMSKLQATEAYQRVSLEGLHVFGGIGFTWEQDSHLYVRRAKSDGMLFGAEGDHLARVARSIGVRSSNPSKQMVSVE